MRTIHKYPLLINDEDHPVMLPGNCKMLLVDVQCGLICLWVELDDTHEIADPSFFRVFGTGQKIPSNYKHLASCQGPPFVWHVYRREGMDHE